MSGAGVPHFTCFRAMAGLEMDIPDLGQLTSIRLLIILAKRLSEVARRGTMHQPRVLFYSGRMRFTIQHRDGFREKVRLKQIWVKEETTMSGKTAR